MVEGENLRIDSEDSMLTSIQGEGSIAFGVDHRFDIGTSRIHTQQEGLSLLNRFLQRWVDFDLLGIFVLNLRDAKAQGNSNYQFYLGKLDNEVPKKPYYLYVSPVPYLGYVPEQIFVIPGTAQIGEQPYYWIEFIEDITKDAQRPAFRSYRLRPDKPSAKIDAKHWRSLNEQLLVDYIFRNNGIKFEDLLPVEVKLDSKGSPYSLGAQSDLALRFAQNHLVNRGDSLYLYPQTDYQGIYSWIDVYKKDGDGNAGKKVSAYRILRDEKRLVNQGWKDPETQLFLDYLSGDMKISFDKLQPAKVTLPERFNLVYFGQGSDKKFSLSIGNSTELGVKEVVIIPKQDPKGLYQWVDIYRLNSETGDPIGEVIASARIIRNIGFVREGWLGAGRQCLIDYTDNKRGFSDLLPIDLQVGANLSMLDVWGVQKEHVWLTLSVKSDLKNGDNVKLIPIEENEGIVIFKMMHEQTELGSYRFDKVTKRFSVIELLDVRSIIPQPRNLLVAYSEGKIGFTELKPIQIKIGKNTRLVDIFKKGKIHIYVCPLRQFGLITGDQVQLSPQEEKEGQVVFALIKDNKVLGFYTYESKSMKFIPRINDRTTYTSIQEWVEEFHNHPEWQGQPTAKVISDRESGGAAFYQAFKKWIKRNARTQEEAEIYKRTIFPDIRSYYPNKEKKPRILLSSDKEASLITADEANEGLDKYFKDI